MKNLDYMKQCYTDIETFMLDYEPGEQIYRYWINGVNDEDVCFYGYIAHVVEVTPNVVMVGIIPYEEGYPDNKYPSIDYYNLNQLHFQWVAADQDTEEECE